MTATDPKRPFKSRLQIVGYKMWLVVLRNFISSQLISTLANVGVIVGLVFLVLEIRQANRIATASTEIEIRSLFSELNEAMYAVPEFDVLLVKAQDKDAELTPVERIRAMGYVLRLTNGWQAIEVAHDSAILPPDTFTVIEDDIQNIVSTYPAFGPLFRRNIESYPGQRSRHVYVILERVLDEQGY